VATRHGILDQPAANKAHSSATPYLGGIAVAAGLLVIGIIAAGAEGQLAVILAGGIALGLLGFIDDRSTVKPGVKLLVEVGAGLALWGVGVRGGFGDIYLLDLFLTVGWVVAITNAVNLLDNMDGVASGVAAVSALSFFAVAAQQGEYLVGGFALAVAGACLGFLRHNFPPARIFLGDAGSLMLGFLLAAIGLKLDLVGPGPIVQAAIPILILAVPIFDTILVIVARLRGGRSIFLGGTDHSSHRLARIGLSAASVARTAYIAQAVYGGLALVLLNSPSAQVRSAAILLAGFLGLLIVFLGLPETDETPPTKRAKQLPRPERERA
jgi:UDP-GlcNAc:undecaprenyl-phosphate GlcNAc-1-phosphate transferase